MDAPHAVDRLFARLRAHGDAPAVVEAGRTFTYADLLARIDHWHAVLAREAIVDGAVVALQSDSTLDAIALLLAAFERRCIVALLAPQTIDADAVAAGLGAEAIFGFGSSAPAVRALAAGAADPLIEALRRQQRAGFIVQTSGSSGTPKAVLHDAERFLAGYAEARKSLVTLAFLLLDHIAGLDTLLYTLHAGGTLVLPDARTPDAVAALIERCGVQVLPTSPSFLRLLCLSGAADRHDCGSLRIITFGSEPMDPATLHQIAAQFPAARLRQKYGASEFGAPRVETRADDPLWFRSGGERAQFDVRDGVLWVRAGATMVGYLHGVPGPAADGEWLCTGDRVAVDGAWIRVLGRGSDLINVGGEKVSPGDVEAVISELACVAQVAVAGVRNSILGQVVQASILPSDAAAPLASVRDAVLAHCRARLRRHEVPAKLLFSTEPLSSARHKLVRRGADALPAAD